MTFLTLQFQVVKVHLSSVYRRHACADRNSSLQLYTKNGSRVWLPSTGHYINSLVLNHGKSTTK